MALISQDMTSSYGESTVTEDPGVQIAEHGCIVLVATSGSVEHVKDV